MRWTRALSPEGSADRSTTCEKTRDDNHGPFECEIRLFHPDDVHQGSTDKQNTEQGHPDSDCKARNPHDRYVARSHLRVL